MMEELLNELNELLTEIGYRFDTNPRCLSADDFKRLVDLQTKIKDILTLISQTQAVFSNDQLETLESLTETGIEDIVRDGDLKEIVCGYPGSTSEIKENIKATDTDTELRIKTIGGCQLIGDNENYDIPVLKIQDPVLTTPISVVGEDRTIEFATINGYPVVNTSDNFDCIDLVENLFIRRTPEQDTVVGELPRFITISFIKNDNGEETDICRILIPDGSSVLTYPALTDDEYDPDFVWDTPLDELRNLSYDDADELQVYYNHN